MKKAKYICYEGTEGVGKTTQVNKLIEYLKSQGYKVLDTREPGTTHVPVTMSMRGLMLDNKFDKDMSVPSREFISQAIRSVHLEKLIKAQMYSYDYIVQDRGILSGLSYGEACNNPINQLRALANYVVRMSGVLPQESGLMDKVNVLLEMVGLRKAYRNLYDHIIILRGNPESNLNRAKGAKQEFETGDAMESRGNSFMERVESNFQRFQNDFKKVSVIHVDGKGIEQVFDEVLDALYDVKD